MKLYRLCTDADKGLVLRSEIEFFQTHFVGEPMAANWQPPPIDILNKSKPVRDFISWMLSAPVVSKRAKTCLEPTIGEFVEFLPLVQLKRKELYTINVLRVIDCLDIEHSDILFDPAEPGRIVSVHRFAFAQRMIPSEPVIFKIPEDLGQVFVSQIFVDTIVSNQLTGSLLLNPGANPFASSIADSPDVLRPV